MEANVPDSHISANVGQDLKPGLSDAKAEFFPSLSPATLTISTEWSEELGRLTRSRRGNSLKMQKEPLRYTFVLRWNWDPRGPTCSL